MRSTLGVVESVPGAWLRLDNWFWPCSLICVAGQVGMDHVFDVLDTNGDGELTQEELHAAFAAFNIAPHDEVAGRIDKVAARPSCVLSVPHCGCSPSLCAP